MLGSQTKKFLSYYKPYLGLFCSIMACALVVAAITLVLPLCVRYITKDVLQGSLPGALDRIYGVGAAMLALIALSTACNFFVDYQGHSMGARMERDLRRELFEHFQKLPLRFYDNEKTGQLMSRITNDLLSLAELYHHAPEDILIYLIKFVGAFFILLGINPQLTFTVFLFLPVLAFFTAYFNRRMNHAYRRNRERIGDVNAFVEDNLSGIRVVKSFANEGFEQAKFAVENNRFLESRKNIYLNEAYLWNGVNAFTQIIPAAVVVFGGARIAQASLDLADLITFMLYISNLMEPILKFTHIANQYQEGITGFERVMEILAVEPEPQPAGQVVELPAVLGKIEFCDVSFKYNDTYEHVLKHITLTINPGDTIALVGPSGAGKTTLCSLIPRLYDVTDGEILLDGIDIRKMPLSALRQNIGIVLQDIYLFAGTVYDNILYGKPGASRQEVIAAAIQANAHDFIMALPNGYETAIGQRGVKLSGGQKQRLSIARVFLKDPPVLIFDEATSALDSGTEKVVQSSMEELAKGRTTIVIAHRLSTIRNAKRTILLTGQQIVEQGIPEALLASDGSLE